MKKVLYTDFTGIDEIIEKMMNSSDFQKAIRKNNLYKFWGNVVGEKFKTGSYPFSMTKGQVMIIACKNNVVAQELIFKKTEILEKLKPYLKSLDLKVRDLRFDSKRWNPADFC